MLQKTARRWLRVIHIIFIAILMGGLTSILVISQLTDLDSHQRYIANLSIYTLLNTVVTYAFYAIVATGLVYSLFTHWGLTRHWWIIGKWVGTLLLFFLVWIWLGPAINGMVALSDAGRDSSGILAAYAQYHDSLAPAIAVAFLIACVLIAITIFRPWGQREQRYEFSRRWILSLVGIALTLTVIMAYMGYQDLEGYRQMPIESPDLTRVPDGLHRGSATYAGFQYVVEVEVEGSCITAVNVIQNRESHYARFAEAVLERMVRDQTPSVDGITGATTTSKCLMKAAEAALKGALQ